MHLLEKAAFSDLLKAILKKLYLPTCWMYKLSNMQRGKCCRLVSSSVHVYDIHLILLQKSCSLHCNFIGNLQNFNHLLGTCITFIWIWQKLWSKIHFLANSITYHTCNVYVYNIRLDFSRGAKKAVHPIVLLQGTYKTWPTYQVPV